MIKQLNNWKKDWTLMPYFFDKHEIQEISKRISNLNIDKVVYCSFESRFGKSGGLGAVTAKILPYLKEVNKIPTVLLITPFHSRIIDEHKLKSTGIAFEVPFNKKSVHIEILEYKFDYTEPKQGSLKEYYLKAVGFFDAQNRLNDPYIFFEDDIDRNDEAIKENALFFCHAVPFAMKALGIQENIIFHLQDWQTSLMSLTSKEAILNGILKSCGTVQTMHNSFDSFIPWESLAKIVSEKRINKISQQFHEGLTAFQIGLQLVDAPITTVSENFAKEFTTDILQTEHFAPHLQQVFKRTGVFGINNGLFTDFPPEFSKDEILNIEKIKKIKSNTRKRLLKILTEYKPPERFGELTYEGNLIINLPESIPIFLMIGRLDFNQKGYDIFLQAIERFAEDEIKVILTPMPVKLSHLDYLREVASRCKGNMTVFPIKMGLGFQELQIGSTFGVMPSIYEPFGAAIEFMVCGTVNIARKTGGLFDQIEDNRCGFSYREDSAHYNFENIKEFYELTDNVKIRKNNEWVQSMVESLYERINDAINLYQNRRNEYYRLILMGVKKAKTFDWSVSAKEYFEVYEEVNRGF